MERLWTLAAVLSQGMQTGLAERGLTLARARVVWELQRTGPCTQRALSRALRVTPRNITGLIDGLEADGLVSRNDHPSDRRVTVVSLTPRGSDLAADMTRDQAGFAQHLLHDVPDADLKKLVAILDRILGRIAELMPRQC